MARSLAETKKAKAAYSRKYRRSKDGRKKTNEYLRKTSKERHSRDKARKVKKAGSGVEVHHKDGNPLNNSVENLVIVKKHHGGGTKGANRNAAGRHKRR